MPKESKVKLVLRAQMAQQDNRAPLVSRDLRVSRVPRVKLVLMAQLVLEAR